MVSITTIQVGNKKFTFPRRVIALTELLENDSKYGYNHICRCGEEQTMSSCINWYTKHDGHFPKNYVCKDCSRTEQFTFFGKTFNRYQEAVDYIDKKGLLRCQECGEKVQRGSIRYWIQELTKNPNKPIRCKPCDDSRKCHEYNKTLKHKEDLIRNMVNMYESRIQETVQNCYKNKFHSRESVEQFAKQLFKIMTKDEHFKERSFSSFTKIYASWFNLLREWNTRPKKSKMRTTYVYIAKDSENKDHLKIGISYRPSTRYSKWSNYYDAVAIRKFDNRYQAAYVEYKLRTLFGNEENSEHVDAKDRQEIIDYVNSVHYNETVHHELELLGWSFD